MCLCRFSHVAEDAGCRLKACRPKSLTLTRMERWCRLVLQEFLLILSWRKRRPLRMTGRQTGRANLSSLWHSQSWLYFVSRSMSSTCLTKMILVVKLVFLFLSWRQATDVCNYLTRKELLIKVFGYLYTWNLFPSCKLHLRQSQPCVQNKYITVIMSLAAEKGSSNPYDLPYLNTSPDSNEFQM